jgi:putative peptidoglycan lipid II flippase
MKERLAKSAGIIGLATLASRLLGLAREQVQAFYFGTSWQADAFVVATRVPGLLRELFAEGAMSAAFVPTLTRTLTRDGKDAAWRLSSQVVNGLLLATGIVVIAGIVFAAPLVTWVAEEYAEVPNKLELTIELTRVNMPFLALVAIAAAFMGMLNALRKFFVPATSPAMYNVVFILSAVVFVPLFQAVGIQPVMALSVGMLSGGLAQILVQWPLLKREGYRHQWKLNLRDPALREILVLMGPGTLGVAAAQVNLLVNTILATDVHGAAAALRYAFQMMYLPIGVFGVSVATATIPDLARQAAERDHTTMSETVSWAIRMMLVLSVPSIVGLIVLASPIVQLVFERGAFDVSSTAMTASALAFYAPGILGYSIVKIVSPSFYSMQDSRTPVAVSVVTIVVNLVLNLWLNSVMGFLGLALGTAIAANVNAGLLMYLLSRRIGGIGGVRIAGTFAKIAVASAIMGVAAFYGHRWLLTILTEATLLQSTVRVLGAISLAIGVLAGSAHLLGVREFGAAMSRVLGRLRR